MKKKIIIFSIINILLYPLSVIISYYIDLILSKKKLQIIEFNQIFSELFLNMQVLKVSLLIQIVMVLFLVVLFISSKNTFTSKLVKVTNKISIPVKAGQGQYGTSRFSDKEEFNESYYKIRIDKKSDEILNNEFGGIVVGFSKNRHYEEINIVADNKHTLCLGNTGAGKTRRVLIESICSLGIAGESIILSDPKGELYALTCNFFKEKGYEVSVIDFRSPLKSNKYNFLQSIIDAIKEKDYGKAEELAWDFVENLVEKKESNTDPLWENGEKSIIAGSIITVLIENQDYEECQNLTNVYTFISNMCKTDENGYMALSEYIEKLEDDNPAKNIFSISTIASEKTRSSFFTSALATLRLFSSKSIYTMTNASDFELEDMGKKKCIRYIILPDDKTAFYPLATIFVSQQYQALVSLANKRGGMLKIRNNFVLEEFGNFTKIANFENMLTVSRGRNIRFSIFIQSFSQLESKYSKTAAQNIMDNTQVWIYLRTSSFDTAEAISKKLGTYTVAVNSQSTSYGKQEKSSSESMNLASRNLLTPDEVLRFREPYALIMQSGEFPTVVKLPDLRKWQFNKILKLGNKEENRIIMENVEKSRKVMEEEDIKLWRIWQDYKY